MTAYAMTASFPGSFQSVRSAVETALKTQGFGILSRIDISSTLKEKIGEQLEPYEILGACNPKLAFKALEADRAIGLLLPCNVVLRKRGEEVEVSIIDPAAMFAVVDDSVRAKIPDLPAEAKKLLGRALENIPEALENVRAILPERST